MTKLRPAQGIDASGIVHQIQPSGFVPDSHWRISSYATRCQTTWIETPTDEVAAKVTGHDMVVDCMACLAKGDEW